MAELASSGDIWKFVMSHYRSVASIALALGIIPSAPSITKWIRTELDRRRLLKRTGGDLYTRGDLLRALTNYVKPYCQSIDPSGGEDFRQTVAVKEDAHKVLHDLLEPTTDERYCLLLADSGMGKTTLLLNFFARHNRKKHPAYKLLLVPLGSPKADRLIVDEADKTNTVLLLDAFDEDTEAILDHRRRLSALLDLSRDFAKILLTCRTQFFEKDDEIPKETGLARFGVKGAGQAGTYRMRKVYLSPFDDSQISKYIKIQFPVWRYKQRATAKEIASRMGDLTARPMLLAHIKDLILERRDYTRTSEIYFAMIDAWLVRESQFVDRGALLSFSEALATQMYLDRTRRGAERIPRTEAAKVAVKCGLSLKDRQLGARSLLNRDAEGNLKFSHRSILEFLFVCDFLRSSIDTLKRRPTAEWTDQMKRFWWDLIGSEADPNHKHAFQIGSAELVNRGRRFGDLSGFFDLGVDALIELRKSPRVDTAANFIRELGQRSTYNLSHRLRTRNFPCFLEGGEGMRGPGRFDALVVDHTTGLMWESECAAAETADNASDHVNDLNQSGYGGFMDWRLPTLVEAISLLPYDIKAYPEIPNSYPFSIFKSWADRIWVSDSHAPRHQFAFAMQSEGPIDPAVEIAAQPLISARGVRSR